MLNAIALLPKWIAWICPVSMTSAFAHCNFSQSIEVEGVKFPYLLACGRYTMPLNAHSNSFISGTDFVSVQYLD